jgi:CheY-like chemotaxis protein
LAERIGSDAEIIPSSSFLRALAQLEKGGFDAVCVDADHLSAAGELGKLLRNDLILRGMADAVVLLDADKNIVWSNARLEAWTARDSVEGINLYEALGNPEILGPDFSPVQTALGSRASSASTLRCTDNRYYRLHAAPIIDNGGAPAHLVATIRDVTDEMLQQQKLAAIHQAGVELADLMPEDVANLNYEERIALLKDNILHCMQDVLQLDVIEIRTLNQQSRELIPLMAVGMEPEAEQRRLFASPEANGVTGFVAATGKSYVCGHTIEDPLYIEGAKGARSSLTVPLLLHDEVIGTLNVENPEANAFNESDLQFVEIFARDLAIALNTLELMAAEKAVAAAASVEAIHSAVALPVDDILNDAVNAMEHYMGLSPELMEPAVVQRLQRILTNARDIKRVIQKVGQAMAPTQARPSLRDEERPWLAGRRILVVAEEDQVRSQAHELLDRFQCIVETAHNGNEACYMTRTLNANEPYDVIIADIRLPDMTGYDLLLKLRTIMAAPPLVLMAGFGYDPGHTIVKARREGLQAVLYKPFRFDQLVKVLEQVMQGGLTPPAVRKDPEPA